MHATVHISGHASRVKNDSMLWRVDMLCTGIYANLSVHLLQKVVARLKPFHFLSDSWCCPSRKWKFIPRSALFIVASGTGFVSTSANISLVPTFLILKFFWATRSCTQWNWVSTCLAFPKPLREPIEIPALASIFTSLIVLIPQSKAVETSPSKLLAPLTSE